MSSFLKKVLPIAVSFIPGVGPLAGAALGAGMGALGGGGLKGALLGGAGGYLGGAVPGGTMGGSLAGKYISGAGAQTIGRAAAGALSGASTGGLKGALLGSAIGGISANSGDITSGIRNSLTGGGKLSSESLLNAPASISNGARADLSGSGGYTTQQISNMVSGGGGASSFSNNNMGSADKPEDLLNAPATMTNETRGVLQGAGGYSTPELNGMTTGPQGASSMLENKNKLSDLLSGGYNVYNTNQQEEELLKGQRAAQDVLNPYYKAGTGALSTLQQRMQNGFNPGDLTQDPGYQFQLEQGNKNLNRSLGAQGSLFSGRALTSAQDYGQGLAQQTYKDAYNRWQQENQGYANLAGTGYSAAGQLGDNYTTYGSTKANADAARGNTITGTLSSLLSGSSARRLVGFDQQGNPIYV